MSDKNLVQSVTKALKIVELLAREGEAGIGEIAQKLGMDKSTIFRLVSTLKQEGIVIQNLSNKKYANGYRLFELGQSVLRQSHAIRTAIYPFMRAIADRTGETVNLAVRDGLEMVYIEMIETGDIIRIGHNLGQRRPIYCTSVGKAMLAWLPEADLDALIREIDFHPFTPTTVSGPEQLREELAFIRKNGYFIDREQHAPGIRCYGTPVLNCNREPVAALSLSMPQYKYEKNPEKEKLCISVILDVMAEFSKTL